MDIWRLYKGEKQTLPVLQRVGAGTQSINTDIAGTVLPTKVYTKVEAVDVIDVVNQFNWTRSPASSRSNTPYIQLIEKRLYMNSNISNIANSVYAAINSGEVVTNSLGKVAEFLGNTDVGKQLINTITGGLTPTEAGTAVSQGVAGSAPVRTVQSAVDSVNTFVQDNFQTFNNSVLQPYNYLYATEKTGFTYKIPYLENLYNSGNISFGESEGAVKGFADIFTGAASGIANIIGGLKPGTYIERAKQFSMGDKGRSITVKFPLLNTGKYQDIIDNWQLIFGLVYQNKPGRVTRAIIDMPVIYEVLIPGIVYMPYGYISSLSVSFLGSRRTMDITIPVYDNNVDTPTTLTTVIPDAYQVEFTVEGMNEETRNFLYANVVSRPVTVSSKQGL